MYILLPGLTIFLPSLLDFFLETDKWRNGFYILLNFTNVDWHATMDKLMYYARKNLIEFFFGRFKKNENIIIKDVREIVFDEILILS